MNDTKPAPAAQPGKQLKPIEEIRSVLMSPAMAEQLRAALPAHISVDKFRRVAVTAIMQNPRLQNVDRASLYQECVKCAQDGLVPDGREAALIDANKKVGDKWIKVARYMPMVWGIAKKVRNSGELAMLTANVVYDKDTFSYWVDDEGEHITHRPLLDGERGQPRLVYALAKTKGGEVYIEVMTLEQIRNVMAMSTNKDKDGNPVGPWEDWWPEMARKSAIRRLSKRLPMSTDKEDEIRRVIERDDELYNLNKARDMGAAQVEPAAPATDKPKRPRRLQQVVDKQAGAVTDPPPGHPAAEPPPEEPPSEKQTPPPEII
ncbi:MAG TPA: recombinase RecT [Burkholderiaceae bacterium]|nr:recombinase RecT [Burkholderiaceae bacterium]